MRIHAKICNMQTNLQVHTLDRRRQHKTHKHTSITRKSDYNDNMQCIVGKLHVKIPLSVRRPLSVRHPLSKTKTHARLCTHWDSFESLETKHRNGNECFSFWESRKCTLELIWTWTTSNDATRECMFVYCIHTWKRLQIHGIRAEKRIKLMERVKVWQSRRPERLWTCCSKLLVQLMCLHEGF